VRTGLPPRTAKQMLTAREAEDFKRYCARYPIDDESNFHAPMAQLTAMYANVNRASGSKPATIPEFLLFREQEPEADIDEQLLTGDW
jgi:hypothetical protein